MRSVSSPALSAALRDIDSELRARFGARLRLVKLFGSWARFEAREDSDIDLAIVIDALRPGERGSALDVVRSVEEAHDILLSALLMTGERFDALSARGAGIARAITEEGQTP